ncbi:MAG TPA: EAL domain-containing protein [Acidisoma sp.]|nr:EAL domain-containing protein [Acidisoma sp.]
MVKLLLAAVLVCFALAAGGTSYLVIQQDSAAHRLARYDIAFDASQGAAELMRLDSSVSGLLLQLPDSSLDQVELRFAILQNRVSVLSRPEFEDFIAGHPEVAGVVQDLSRLVDRIGPHIAKADDSKVAVAIVTQIKPMESRLIQLSALCSTIVGNNIESGETRLRQLHFVSAAVTGMLIALGVVLIVILLRDNQLMSVNNRRLSRLTDELQRTGSQLSTAHAAVAKANQDLNAQNATLRSRDRDLAVQNARFDAALNNMSQALLMADGTDRLIVCNNRFLEMFGLTWLDVVPGRDVGTLFDLMGERERLPAALIPQIREVAQRLMRERVGGSFYAEAEGRAIKVDLKPMNGGGWVATLEDMTEQRRAEAQTTYLAHHDPLTDLPNRLMFTQQLNRALQSRASCGMFALLLLDLDDFKDVNDTLGHLAGDSLLVAAAQRLRSCLGPEDAVARLGGDEFAIIQTGSGDADETELLAQRIIAAMSEPFVFEGQRVAPGASIGIALRTDDSADAEGLLRSADMALYRAKAEGRNTWRFFKREMEEAVRQRSAIASDIRQALDRDELEAFYQPIFETQSGVLRQFEALMRWRHPRLGLVAPDRFIRVAEDTRLILPMGEWVIGEACRAATALPEEIRMAVNLSPMQFRSHQLPLMVEQALMRSGLAPHRLELEVTESALLHDQDHVRATLRELRALGVTVALDDFGTGYASLSYLQQFPFDKIKIDRSFVSEIVSRSDSLAIVESVIRLGGKLGMATTAEGIETPEQLAILRSFGCTFAQGFLFDRPQPFGTVRRKMADGIYKLSDAAAINFL